MTLALSGIVLGSSSLTADSLTLFLRGQKLSECMFIHLANVLFPLCLSQPKHAINGRHQPKIFSVLAPTGPLTPVVACGKYLPNFLPLISFGLFSTGKTMQLRFK